MTDRITEHYQENPEGARLVSDEDIRGRSEQAGSREEVCGLCGGKTG